MDLIRADIREKEGRRLQIEEDIHLYQREIADDEIILERMQPAVFILQTNPPQRAYGREMPENDELVASLNAKIFEKKRKVALKTEKLEDLKLKLNNSRVHLYAALNALQN